MPTMQEVMDKMATLEARLARAEAELAATRTTANRNASDIAYHVTVDDDLRDRIDRLNTNKLDDADNVVKANHISVGGKNEDVMARLIRVMDTAGLFTATDVENVLAEIGGEVDTNTSDISTLEGYFTSALSGYLDWDNGADYSVSLEFSEGVLIGCTVGASAGPASATWTPA